MGESPMADQVPALFKQNIMHASIFLNGGIVTMPLEPTFWAVRFGMMIDQFGVPWMVNCEAPQA